MASDKLRRCEGMFSAGRRKRRAGRPCYPRERRRGSAALPSLSSHPALPAYTREFLICDGVEDFEGFGVEGGVGAEGEFAEVAFFHFDDEFFVFGARAKIAEGRSSRAAGMAAQATPMKAQWPASATA